MLSLSRVQRTSPRAANQGDKSCSRPVRGRAGAGMFRLLLAGYRPVMMSVGASSEEAGGDRRSGAGDRRTGRERPGRRSRRSAAEPPIPCFVDIEDGEPAGLAEEPKLDV